MGAEDGDGRVDDGRGIHAAQPDMRIEVMGAITRLRHVLVLICVRRRVSLIVGVERAADPARQALDPRRRGQHHDVGIGAERPKRTRQECLHGLADPKYHFGLFQRLRDRRAHGVGVRRFTTGHEERRRADSLHDPGNQRVNWRDGRQDLGRRLRRAGRRQNQCQRTGRRAKQTGSYRHRSPLGVTL